ITWQECNNVNDDPCTKTVIRVLRVAVGVVGTNIVASTDPKKGFLDCRFGDGQDSVQFPMITVNKNNDMVIAFERFSLANRVPTGVRYRVWYHDHANISEGAWIHPGEPVPSGQGIPDPTLGAAVDLGASWLDPEDHETVWISHAFSDSSGTFQSVIAAVKP